MASTLVETLTTPAGHTTDLPCSCTSETIERMLASLGREKRHRMIEEQETTDVSCESCGQRYPFSGEELAYLMEEKRRQTSRASPPQMLIASLVAETGQ